MSALIEKYKEELRKGNSITLSMNDLDNIKIDNTNKKIRTIDDLIMVHKTDFPPTGAIMTPRESNKPTKKSDIISLDGEERDFEYSSVPSRNSIHFCLNGGVRSHPGGNWDECKYAILMPLGSNKNKIVAGTECDLFSQGSIPINETAVILCPENEINELKRNNSNATIIGYNGPNVTPFIDPVLSQFLGYKYMRPTQNSRYWNNGLGSEHELVENIFKENGWEITDHTGSKWDIEDQFIAFKDKLIATLKFIKEEMLLYNEKNITPILKQITNLISKVLILYFRVNISLRPEKREQEFGIEKEKCTQLILQFLTMISKEAKLEIDLAALNIEALNKHTTYNPEKIDTIDWYADEISNELGKSLIGLMREKSIQEKKDHGLLTPKETFLIQCKEYLNDDIFEIIDPPLLDFFFNILDKDLSSLSEEELSTMINVQNLLLSNMNKGNQQLGQKFELVNLSEITKEAALLFKESFDEYIVIRKSGLYLTFNSKGKDKVMSELTGVNIKNLYDILNSNASSEVIYAASKALATIPGSHFLDYSNNITDCDLSNCKTVIELFSKLATYTKQFKAFFNKPNLNMNSKNHFGEIQELLDELETPDIPEQIIQEDNPEEKRKLGK